MKAILIEPHNFFKIQSRTATPLITLQRIFDDSVEAKESRYFINNELHGWVAITESYLKKTYVWEADARIDIGFVHVYRKGRCGGCRDLSPHHIPGCTGNWG